MIYSQEGYYPWDIDPNALNGKIPLVKAMRSKWGLGLKEAKDLVDALFEGAEKIKADKAAAEEAARQRRRDEDYVESIKSVVGPFSYQKNNRDALRVIKDYITAWEDGK